MAYDIHNEFEGSNPVVKPGNADRALKSPDVFDVLSRYIPIWEGGQHNFNPHTQMWTAYADKLAGGKPTVGHGLTGRLGGENIVAGQEYPADAVTSRTRELNQADYDWLSQKAGQGFGDLNPNQQASVVSLLHNVGADQFKDSKAFQHLKAGQYDKFAHEAFDPEVGFVKSTQWNPETQQNEKKIVEGLQNRRRYESDLFNTPWVNIDDVVNQQGTEAFTQPS